MTALASDSALLQDAVAPARIELCGALTAEIGGRRVERLLPGRKGRQLFARLVVERGRSIGRDELIDMIWPEDSPADPDGTFSTLLTRLRTAVGRELIVGRSELMLDLGSDAWIDWHVALSSVANAEATLAADAVGALRHALAGLEIARRPLLPGASTPWLEDRRRELAETRASLLDVSARAALALGGEHLPVAERSARELIEREPYRECGYALLMEAHASRGNVAEALRVYDGLRRLLRQELGLTPAASVTAFAERLLEGMGDGGPAPAAGTAGPGPLPPALAAPIARPLVGPREPLRRMARAALELPSGGYRVLALTGVAGIGKSRLAAEVAARVHAGGGEVLYGRAQRDVLTPCRPLVEALREYLAHDDGAARELLPELAPELAELAALVPELRRVVPAPSGGLSSRRIGDAIAALCGAIARARPVLIVLEDLQWADHATVALLRLLARATSGARLSVLVTLRDDAPVRSDLARVLVDCGRERTLLQLSVRELDARATADLVSAHRARPTSPGDVRSIRDRTGGNPFRIEELLHAEG
jgi:DNA-binding SARP family transcriptional activator